MSAYEFMFPDVGEGLSEGEIVRWHVAPGERIRVHESLVDVQTDKAIVEIPAPVSGTLVRHGGTPGDVIAVGAVLAVIEGDEAPRDVETPAPAGRTDAASGSDVAEPATPPSSAPGSAPAATGAFGRAPRCVSWRANEVSISPPSPEAAAAARSPARTWRRRLPKPMRSRKRHRPGLRRRRKAKTASSPCVACATESRRP